MSSGLITNMKHTLYILLFITALVLAGCASKPRKANTAQNTQTLEPVQIIIEEEKEPAAAEETTPSLRPTFSTNHSFLSEEHLGQTFTIKGYLSQNGDNFILTENPTSKSRVTFYLEVAEQSLIEKATGLVNSTVEITGLLTDAPSPWSKKLKVLIIN